MAQPSFRCGALSIATVLEGESTILGVESMVGVRVGLGVGVVDDGLCC